MVASYRVYIDESGDEGFTFLPHPQKGSSEWFVLSAFAVRAINDGQCVNRLREFRTATNREKDAHVHWRKLPHGQKVLYAQIVAEMSARGCSVAVHKPSLKDAATFGGRDVLYFYAVRYLLERVSWLARDNRIDGQGDGRAELWFSKRKNLSYSNLLNYLSLLKTKKGAGEDIRIEFSSLEMDPSKVHVESPVSWAGLQLVDALAGATLNALETDTYGSREARYAHILRPILYKHNGSAESYGIKIVPGDALAVVNAECTAGRMERFW